jgi:hypothetical protein
VTASVESWSRPADRTRLALAACLAGVAFLGAWALLHVGFYSRSQLVDTGVYQRYGAAIVEGEVPYRDFRPEYPPAALPVFALPALADSADEDGYRDGFEALMAVLGLAVVALVAVTLAALRAPPARLGLALAFAALWPLALGSVVLTRFDLWPAALTVGALAALVSGRDRLAAAVLGVAVAAKVYPAVLVPLAAVWIWRRRGRREALVAGGVFLAVLAAAVFPFVVAGGGGGLAWSVERQLSRPLQLESLGSALLLAAHHVTGLALGVETSHGSQNVAGQGGAAAGVATTVLQVVALVGVWVVFARGPMERERLVRYSAGAVAAFVAFGKVLSPQFLIWLVPLVPLVRGRRGLAASGLLALALVLTQLWFPFRYWDLALRLEPGPSWLVLARDLVLVSLVAVLLLERRPDAAEARSDARG